MSRSAPARCMSSPGGADAPVRLPTSPRRRPLADGLVGDPSAVLSPCRTYRYELRRVWDAQLPMAGWVMLNPSRADAKTDDASIRRCAGFARRWGCGGIVVRNVFALRATDPDRLLDHPEPVGPDNDRFLLRCLDDPLTVLAWGDRGGARAAQVGERLLRSGVLLAHLGMTRRGAPRHPLRLRADTALMSLPCRARPHRRVELG